MNEGMTPTQQPPPIPPLVRATAMIGREVRIVEWLPTPPKPIPPPRSTYRGPRHWTDTQEPEQERTS